MIKVRVLAFLLLAMGLAWGVLVVPAARSNAGGSEAKAVRWEYRTELVEAAALSAKLSEWANADWEIVFLTDADRVLETNETTRIRIDKFQVTARKPLK